MADISIKQKKYTKYGRKTMNNHIKKLFFKKTMVQTQASIRMVFFLISVFANNDVKHDCKSQE